MKDFALLNALFFRNRIPALPGQQAFYLLQPWNFCKYFFDFLRVLNAINLMEEDPEDVIEEHGQAGSGRDGD